MSLDSDSMRTLLELPVNETRQFNFNDRNFTLIDTAEFERICELAKIVNEPIHNCPKDFKRVETFIKAGLYDSIQPFAIWERCKCGNIRRIKEGT